MSGPEHEINRNLLIGPNIATGDWIPEDVWNTGFVDTFSANLAYLAVEKCVPPMPPILEPADYDSYCLLAIQPIIALHNSAAGGPWTCKQSSRIISAMTRERRS